MEDKGNAYLSVKDIARIKSKHEETIRRWINANKIEVPKFSSKKEGYSIPVDSLIQSGILTKEEVESYLNPDSSDPRLEKTSSLPDWQALIREHEGAEGEELLLLITELSRVQQDYGRKRKMLTERILELKNQIAELEYETASCENSGQQINDYITYLRGKL